MGPQCSGPVNTEGPVNSWSHILHCASNDGAVNIHISDEMLLLTVNVPLAHRAGPTCESGFVSLLNTTEGLRQETEHTHARTHTHYIYIHCMYVHTNNCTVVRHNATQACGQPATCFSHLQEGIQQREVQSQLGYVTDVHYCSYNANIASYYCTFLC